MVTRQAMDPLCPLKKDSREAKGKLGDPDSSYLKSASERRHQGEPGWRQAVRSNHIQTYCGGGAAQIRQRDCALCRKRRIKNAMQIWATKRCSGVKGAKDMPRTPHMELEMLVRNLTQGARALWANESGTQRRHPGLERTGDDGCVAGHLRWNLHTKRVTWSRSSRTW